MNPNQGGNQNDGSLKDLWIGIAITIGIYVIGFFVLMPLISLLGLFIALGTHIVVIVLSFQKGRVRMGQGLLIGLGLMVLLVAACFGILIYTLGFRY